MAHSHSVSDAHLGEATTHQRNGLLAADAATLHEVDRAEGVTAPGCLPWLPSLLRRPSVSGATGDVKFAFFADKRRLLLEHAGQWMLYDCGVHWIKGVSILPNADLSSMVLLSQRGDLCIEALRPLSFARVQEIPV
jgi:hypothetical protein